MSTEPEEPLMDPAEPVAVLLPAIAWVLMLEWLANLSRDMQLIVEAHDPDDTSEAGRYARSVGRTAAQTHRMFQSVLPPLPSSAELDTHPAGRSGLRTFGTIH